MLREEPHTQKAAEAAIGLKTDNGRTTGKGSTILATGESAMEVET